MDMDINKRAEQYADIVSNHGLYEEHGIYDIEVAYKQGWKDAVEAVCDWLDDELYQTQTGNPCYPTDIACQTYYEKKDLFEALRKAMEGKV